MGSNFLTETYLSLRRMENEIVRSLIDAREGRTKDQRDHSAGSHDGNLLNFRQFCSQIVQEQGVYDFVDVLNAGMRRALIDLFRVLDQKPENRDPYMDEDLAAFPYVNVSNRSGTRGL